MAYFLFFPFRKRVKPLKEATDCIDLIPMAISQKIWREVEDEMPNML